MPAPSEPSPDPPGLYFMLLFFPHHNQVAHINPCRRGLSTSLPFIRWNPEALSPAGFPLHHRFGATYQECQHNSYSSLPPPAHPAVHPHTWPVLSLLCEQITGSPISPWAWWREGQQGQVPWCWGHLWGVHLGWLFLLDPVPMHPFFMNDGYCGTCPKSRFGGSDSTQE